MPTVAPGWRATYEKWAKENGKPMPDHRHWVHESHWAEFLQRKEDPLP